MKNIREIILPTFGYNTKHSDDLGYQKCVIATVDSIAVVVRVDHVKFFSKFWKAISRCQNLLVIVICLAFIFGVLIYTSGTLAADSHSCLDVLKYNLLPAFIDYEFIADLQI